MPNHLYGDASETSIREHKRSKPIGLALFVAALIGIAIRSAITVSPIPGWQPIPFDYLGRGMPIIADAVVQIALASCLLVERTRRWGAIGLIILTLIWIALLQGPGLIAQPGNVALWLGVAEVGAITAAALVIFAESFPGLKHQRRVVRIASISFGCCAITFGTSHFVYADFTATMVPGWLPARTFWAYFTGACHMGAGLAILLGFWQRRSALLLSLMMAMFVLLVHVPRVVGSAGSAIEIAFLLNACALAGAALVFATSPSFVGNSISSR